MICNKCGCEVNDNLKVCASCGNLLSSSSEHPSENVPPGISPSADYTHPVSQEPSIKTSDTATQAPPENKHSMTSQLTSFSVDKLFGIAQKILGGIPDKVLHIAAIVFGISALLFFNIPGVGIFLAIIGLLLGLYNRKCVANTGRTSFIVTAGFYIPILTLLLCLISLNTCISGCNSTDDTDKTSHVQTTTPTPATDQTPEQDFVFGNEPEFNPPEFIPPEIDDFDSYEEWSDAYDKAYEEWSDTYDRAFEEWSAAWDVWYLQGGDITSVPASTSPPTPSPSTTTVPAPKPTPTASPAQAPDNSILTKSNNEDLRILLETYVPNRDDVAAFVDKYGGRTIEIDAHIFMLTQESNYANIEYDVMIVYGDSEWDDIGPTDDMESFGYGITLMAQKTRSTKFPGVLIENQNVRIVAIILGMEHELTETILIDPISIDKR